MTVFEEYCMIVKEEGPHKILRSKRIHNLYNSWKIKRHSKNLVKGLKQLKKSTKKLDRAKQILAKHEGLAKAAKMQVDSSKSRLEHRKKLKDLYLKRKAEVASKKAVAPMQNRKSKKPATAQNVTPFKGTSAQKAAQKAAS